MLSILSLLQSELEKKDVCESLSALMYLLERAIYFLLLGKSKTEINQESAARRAEQEPWRPREPGEHVAAMAGRGSRGGPGLRGLSQ